MTTTTLPIPIVALDVPSTRDALALVDRLGAGCRFYKVGSELFTSEGPDVVRRIREHGADVFLDLKLYDIPNTVRGAARAAARLGVRLLTVHAAGGVPMMEAARDGAGTDGALGVLAVSVLTSFDAPTLREATGRDEVTAGEEVLRLADLAVRAGVHGLVCAGTEVEAVRRRHGSALAVLVPGIRMAGAAIHDQARVVTPVDAARAGARYMVLGRAVTAAADPIAALASISQDVASV